MLLNVGPSRADTLPGIEKIDMPSGSVMNEAAKAIMWVYLAKITIDLINF
jgi:NAD+-dependent protein deacetylase sirtuin 4